MNIIKDKIYQLRHKWGMTQAEFAEKVEVSQVMVSLWELGKRDPSKEMLYKIAKAFDTSVEWLLKAEEPKQEEKVFTKDEIIQQCRPTVDEANPVGALFFLLGRYMKIDDIEDNNGETQIIATIRGEVAEIVKGMMYMQEGVESGYFDKEMMSIWKEKKLKEYGVEVVK
jgi:transcriptional regulator with XRE-family HTH domain